jgi:hypothetical protein
MAPGARADDIRSVGRRLVLVTLIALAFCGVAGAAASGDPQYQPAPADQSWADGIVLNAKDLGTGWHSLGTGGNVTGAGEDSATCSGPDEADLILTGGSYSPDFIRTDGAWVTSSAMVWQTPEQAQADWDRNVQPGLMGCLAAALQELGTKQIKVVVTGRRQLEWPALAPRSAAYRISLVLKASVKVRKKLRKVSIAATADFIVVGTGRATAVLSTISYNRQPLSDFAKQRYAITMVRRMAVDPAPK